MSEFKVGDLFVIHSDRKVYKIIAMNGKHITGRIDNDIVWTYTDWFQVRHATQEEIDAGRRLS